MQENQPLREAERLVRTHRVDEIPIVDAEGRPVGLLDVQDLITLKIVRDPS
ncbi:MAG: CBS domain-containing protein [Planctomycetota bacterium]|nr:CBS domain-containing protein [Planctomycetota bacterium]